MSTVAAPLVWLDLMPVGEPPHLSAQLAPEKQHCSQDSFYTKRITAWPPETRNKHKKTLQFLLAYEV